MANAAPLNTLTAGAGGQLVLPNYIADPLISQINRRAAVAQMARVDRVATQRTVWPTYLGRPQAFFVDEGAEKPVTGAEFGSLELTLKKIAAIVVYTEEMIEDAATDPTVLINADVEGAIADLIDAHALGMSNGAAITSNFQTALTATTSSVELGTAPDALALAVSQAMGIIEGNGYVPTGAIYAYDVRQHMRDARGPGDLAATPVYGAGAGTGYQDNLPALYGINQAWTTNLDGFPAAAGKVVAIVGDFRNSVMAIRKDITVRTTNQATINIGGTQHNLWQRNEVAALWETRVGFQVFEPNRSIVKIVNAT